jgi:hypothetical protein
MATRAIRYPLGIFFYVATLWAHALEVEPYCLMTRLHIGVSVTGSLTYKNGKSMLRHVHIDCSRTKCEGFIRASSWQHTRAIRDLHIDYKNSNIVVMRAGLSEFRLDRSTRSFTWIENPDETSGRFDATCPEFIGTTGDQ